MCAMHCTTKRLIVLVCLQIPRVLVGDRELAKLLLLRGADVGAANPRGTALHVAAARGHAAVVSVLLNHGADVRGRGDADS
jgi:ankyrin repeat protein